MPATALPATPEKSAKSDWPRPSLAWYGVSILFVAFVLSSIDRVILGLLLTLVEKDLALSDAAMGALLGTSFALAYSSTGLLAGWLADRFSRRRLVSGAVFLWSLATAACGVASTFTELLIGRLSVAVGESALTPSAYSLIADYFPPKTLGRALSVYMSGALLGGGLSFLLGGALLAYLAEPLHSTPALLRTLHPWQLAFLLAAAPGLLVALLGLTLKEPPRRGVVQSRASLAALLRFLRARAALFTLHLLGFSFLASIIVVILSWSPTMFVRVHGFSHGEAGLALGLMLLILAPAGVYAGGWLMDILRRTGRVDAPFRIGILSALLCLPFAVAANLVSDGTLAVALYCPFIFTASLAVACGATAIQIVTPNEFRAQISALYLIVLNLLSSTLGATCVGVATHFLFRTDLAVGRSMALVCGLCAPLGALLLAQGCRTFRDAANAPERAAASMTIASPGR